MKNFFLKNLKKIFFNKKLISFFMKIKQAILNNGFSHYIIETTLPTFRFLSFILKNINKIYSFLIEKINLKKLVPYSVVIILIIFILFKIGEAIHGISMKIWRGETKNDSDKV